MAKVIGIEKKEEMSDDGSESQLFPSFSTVEWMAVTYNI